MAIQRRYTDEEFRRLTELIHPEERRYEFTDQPWGGEGFRHRWPIVPVTISFAAALIGRERLSIAARGRAAQQG